MPLQVLPDTLLLYCSSAPALVTWGQKQVQMPEYTPISFWASPPAGPVNNAILTQPNNELNYIDIQNLLKILIFMK
jgi:hypothetical protein